MGGLLCDRDHAWSASARPRRKSTPPRACVMRAIGMNAARAAAPEDSMTQSAGIHHVTAICSDPRRNVAFYGSSLGLRLVKRTVNFDDPTSWHLYYGDETGSPGTALTFFARGNVPPGRQGIGQAAATAFIIPERSLAYWTDRLNERGVPHDGPERRFDLTSVAFRDPDGMNLELVAAKGARALAAWAQGPVPAEHAIRGIFGVT